MRLRLLPSAGAILIAVAALTGCASASGNVMPPEAPTSTDGTNGGEPGGDGTGARVDPRRFQALMTECMADEGWTVVSAPDGAVKPADAADETDPRFNEAIVICMEQAAPALE